MASDRWALRRALKDKDLYDTKKRIRLDLDEIAHPADIALRKSEFRDWGSWHEDLTGIGVTFKPKSILEIGVGLGYSGYCLCSGALLGGRSRVKYVGMDAELDTSPPQMGYRTLAIAAETFRRHLPEVRGSFYRHDTVRDDLPSEVQLQRFNLVHVDGDDSERGTFGDIKWGWDVLALGGMLVVSRLHCDTRERGLTDFFSWLLASGEAFASQWVHNDIGMTIFRKGE